MTVAANLAASCKQYADLTKFRLGCVCAKSSTSPNQQPTQAWKCIAVAPSHRRCPRMHSLLTNQFIDSKQCDMFIVLLCSFHRFTAGFFLLYFYYILTDVFYLLWWYVPYLYFHNSSVSFMYLVSPFIHEVDCRSDIKGKFSKDKRCVKSIRSE